MKTQLIDGKLYAAGIEHIGKSEPEPAPCVFEEGKRVYKFFVCLERLYMGICQKGLDTERDAVLVDDPLKLLGVNPWPFTLRSLWRDTPEQALADARAWQKSEVERIAAIEFELPAVEG